MNQSSRPMTSADHVVADANAYLSLRDAIEATMHEPDRWDDDAAEESVLADYVEALAGIRDEALSTLARPGRGGLHRYGPVGIHANPCPACQLRDRILEADRRWDQLP